MLTLTKEHGHSEGGGGGGDAFIEQFPQRCQVRVRVKPPCEVLQYYERNLKCLWSFGGSYNDFEVVYVY